MSEKWTEKDVLDHARELKSPFDSALPVNPMMTMPPGTNPMIDKLKMLSVQNRQNGANQ